MKRIIFLPIVMAMAVCLGCACTRQAKEERHGVGEHEEAAAEVKKPKVVHVCYYARLNKSLGCPVVKELKQIFDSVDFCGYMPYPDSAYYAPRKRYRADVLIQDLRKRWPAPEDELMIGFVPYDISCSVHGYKDYGVMGLTSYSLRTAVVSPHRLNDWNTIHDDFLKLVLHELGHAEGLPHCSNDSCYMRDAEGRNHFGELTGFCDKCSAHLKARGWKLQ